MVPSTATRRRSADKEGTMFQRTLLFALTCLGALTTSTRADVITDWNEKAVTFVTPRMPPPQEHRVTAMVDVAMFDAVNSIERRYRPYLIQLPAAPMTSRETAAATAAATVLIGLHPAAADELKTALDAYLVAIPNGAAKAGAIKLGEAVAAKILEARANDGSGAPDDYRPRTTPGVYVPTPRLVAPMWPKVTPFALTSPAQFRPGPPVSLVSEQWAADLNEIKGYGSRTSSKRTARPPEAARFCLITCPPADDPILRPLATRRKRGLVLSARFLRLTPAAATP